MSKIDASSKFPPMTVTYETEVTAVDRIFLAWLDWAKKNFLDDTDSRKTAVAAALQDIEEANCGKC